MSDSPWRLLRTGHREEAIRQFRSAFVQMGGSSEIMELGIAHLWIAEYQAASDHFEAANTKYPKHADAFYGMAGVARWCLDDRAAAIDLWHDGLECEFVDFAGGIRLPLLLFSASLLDPAVYATSDAEELLRTRLKGPFAENWPGPIARFLLGQIDEPSLRAKSKGYNDRDTYSRRWRADYYMGVFAMVRGTLDAFNSAMIAASTTADDDFEPTKPQFLTKVWHEEFFIARHVVLRGRGDLV